MSEDNPALGTLRSSSTTEGGKRMQALPTAMVQLYAVIGISALVVAGVTVLRRRRRTSLEEEVQRLECLARLLRARRELREELDLQEEGA